MNCSEIWVLQIDAGDVDFQMNNLQAQAKEGRKVAENGTHTFKANRESRGGRGCWDCYTHLMGRIIGEVKKQEFAYNVLNMKLRNFSMTC